MKKIFFYIIYFFITINTALAQDSGVFGNSISGEKLRRGEVHVEDIPNMIRGVINFLLGISGTIAIIFIIIGAYQVLFSGFEGDKSKGKNTIILALTGFAIASLAWFIIKLILDNLSGA